jgi:hypothetical protein
VEDQGAKEVVAGEGVMAQPRGRRRSQVKGRN